MPASRRHRCATRWPRCCAARRSARSTRTRRSSTSSSGACRAVRSDLFAIKRLPIDTGGGGYVPLEAVADVTLAPTPNEITREGGSRRIDVTTQRPRPRSGRGGAGHPGRARHGDLPRGLPRGGAGRIRGARGVAEPAAGHRLPVAARHPAGAARRLRLGAAGRAGRPDAALRPDRRRGGGVPVRRRAVARLARRLRHRARHRRPQRHHAGEPLSPPGGRGGHAVRPRARASAAPRSGWRRS